MSVELVHEFNTEQLERILGVIPGEPLLITAYPVGNVDYKDFYRQFNNYSNLKVNNISFPNNTLPVLELENPSKDSILTLIKTYEQARKNLNILKHESRLQFHEAIWRNEDTPFHIKLKRYEIEFMYKGAEPQFVRTIRKILGVPSKVILNTSQYL